MALLYGRWRPPTLWKSTRSSPRIAAGRIRTSAQTSEPPPQPRIARIFYHRPDQQYDGFTIHVWYDDQHDHDDDKH